ncbi:hypothetical protein CCP3SC1_50034 [Gammaproteobacteria bacterium]
MYMDTVISAQVLLVRQDAVVAQGCGQNQESAFNAPMGHELPTSIWPDSRRGRRRSRVRRRFWIWRNRLRISENIGLTSR